MATASTTTLAQTANREVLYTPSWVDRLNDWVGKLPVPGGLFYLLVVLVVVLGESAIK